MVDESDPTTDFESLVDQADDRHGPGPQDMLSGQTMTHQLAQRRQLHRQHHLSQTGTVQDMFGSGDVGGEADKGTGTVWLR